MGKLTKAALIKDVADLAGGLGQSDIERVLDAVSRAAIDAMSAGDDVVLPGLGILKPKARPGRTGRNPATGASVEIPPKTAVTFKVAKSLADALNE